MPEENLLTVNFLSHLLGDLGVHWYEMGLHLRLKKELLDEIGRDCGKSYQCLIEMFDCWLLQGEDCTWSAIKKMLHSMDKNAHIRDIHHYVTELQRIKNKQQKFNKHCRKLVPMPDHCYEDWWLERLYFENDRLSYYPDPTLEDWLERLPKFLTDIGAQWYRIGIGLNLPKSSLDKIDRNCKGGCDQKFQEVIIRWQEMDPEHSWRKLIVTFKDLGLGKIAKSIEEEAWREVKKESRKERVVYDESCQYMREHWQEMNDRRDKFEVQINQKKNQRELRYHSLVKQIRDVLKPPESISDDVFMSDIESYIHSDDRKQDDILKVVETVRKIEKECSEYAEGLNDWGKELMDDIKYTQEVQGKLTKRKQALEEERSYLESKKNDLDEEITRVQESNEVSSEKKKMLNRLGYKMQIIEGKLDDVKKRLADCIVQLDYANSNYMELSGKLNDCITELNNCIKEYGRCIEIVEACKKKENTWYSLIEGTFYWAVNYDAVHGGYQKILDDFDDFTGKTVKEIEKTKEQIREIKDGLIDKGHHPNP